MSAAGQWLIQCTKAIKRPASCCTCQANTTNSEYGKAITARPIADKVRGANKGAVSRFATGS